MSFTGKSTFTAGATLPEIAEDVSDIVGIVSPFETPLLDALGDPAREARSTYHEWLEDSLLANSDVVTQESILMPETDSSFEVANCDRFRAGDQIMVEGSREVMLVTGAGAGLLNVLRGYGGTTPEAVNPGDIIRIIGPSAAEGSDCPDARFTSRLRRGNWTQIFTAGVEVSGSNMAVGHIALADEMDYQKQMRIRELLRDIENTVINGTQPAANPQGTTSAARTMNGIIRHIQTNLFTTGDSGLPVGTTLSEELLNYALREIWERSCGNIDLIVVGGEQKRRINSFISSARRYAPQDDAAGGMVNIYESDFGLCRVVMSRWMPRGTVLLLDSSRVNVLPLAGRSMHFKSLASTGDFERGELIGEYTLEMRNEEAHGIIRGLD
ncbi:MAG: DUF5309 family protein [Phycisphaerae bacterium]|jgi:hypothetical protein